MTIICQMSLLLFFVVYYVHLSGVVNFFYVFMLQLIEYYLLIKNPVCDLKKSYYNSSNPVLNSGKLTEKKLT